MFDVIYHIMLGLFLIGTPVLLYASWADEYFMIIRRPYPRPRGRPQLRIV